MSKYLKPIWPALFIFAILVLEFFVWRSEWGWWRDPYHPNEWWIGLLIPLFLGLIVSGMAITGAAALGYGLGYVIGRHCKKVWRLCWRARLASLRSVDGAEGSISGNVFMIAGNIGSRQVYYYYTTHEPDAYVPHKWFPNQDTTIWEEDRSDGEVKQFETVFDYGDSMLWIAVPEERYRMDFHIPRGSLKRQFLVE